MAPIKTTAVLLGVLVVLFLLWVDFELLIAP